VRQRRSDGRSSERAKQREAACASLRRRSRCLLFAPRVLFAVRPSLASLGLRFAPLHALRNPCPERNGAAALGAREYDHEAKCDRAYNRAYDRKCDRAYNRAYDPKCDREVRQSVRRRLHKAGCSCWLLVSCSSCPSHAQPPIPTPPRQPPSSATTLLSIPSLLRHVRPLGPRSINPRAILRRPHPQAYRKSSPPAERQQGQG